MSYEEAVDSGRTAVLHEEALKGVHVLSVAHVPPGREIVTEVTWSKPLSYAGPVPTLRIPTTVAQVYGRLPLLPADDLVTSDDLVFRADVTVRAEGSEVSLDRVGVLDGSPVTVLMDAPIDLRFAEGPATAGRVAGVASDGRRVTLDVARGVEGEMPLDVSVLFDRSGSMGDRVARADGTTATKWTLSRDGLQAALRERARPGDRVVLWQYDDQHDRLGETTDGSAHLLTDLVGRHRGGNRHRGGDQGSARRRHQGRAGADGRAVGALARPPGRPGTARVGGADRLETPWTPPSVTSSPWGGPDPGRGRGCPCGSAASRALGLLRYPGSPSVAATATTIPGDAGAQAGADLLVRVRSRHRPRRQGRRGRGLRGLPRPSHDGGGGGRRVGRGARPVHPPHLPGDGGRGRPDPGGRPRAAQGATVAPDRGGLGGVRLRGPGRFRPEGVLHGEGGPRPCLGPRGQDALRSVRRHAPRGVRRAVRSWRGSPTTWARRPTGRCPSAPRRRCADRGVPSDVPPKPWASADQGCHPGPT